MTATQTMPRLPAGFTMRPPAEEDLAACVALLERCADLKQDDDHYTVAELAAEWSSPGATADKNFRVITDPNGRLAAYYEAWDIQTPPVNVWVWGRVDPEFEGLGLGSALLDWAEGVARSAAERCPPDAKVVMRVGAVNDYAPARELFRGRGMTPVRQFYRMKILFNGAPPAAPQWPAGIRLRPYRHPEDLPAIIAADMEAFQDHWGFMARPLDEEVEHWRHHTDQDPNFDPAYWLMAVDEGKLTAGSDLVDALAGVCLCFPQRSVEPDVLHINALAVRRPWRRQGLATALLHEVFTAAYRTGLAGVTLGVDAANLSGATRLYTNAGMEVTRASHVYEQVVRPGVSLLNEG